MRARIFTLHLIVLSRNASPTKRTDQRYYVFADIHIHIAKLQEKEDNTKKLNYFKFTLFARTQKR